MEKFYSLLNEWNEYCKKDEVQISSNSRNITDCQQFRELTSMGVGILPLIKDAYNNPELSKTLILHGLPKLIKSLTGDRFVIPNGIAGKMEEIKKYTINWLEASSS